MSHIFKGKIVRGELWLFCSCGYHAICSPAEGRRVMNAHTEPVAIVARIKAFKDGPLGRKIVFEPVVARDADAYEPPSAGELEPSGDPFASRTAIGKVAQRHEPLD
jgi:hypothetical protein